MNPVELTRGRSFKGLAAYLLHDPEKARTAERVGWSESINLMDAPPDRAWKLMAATAQSADALKEAAGQRRGGAKNTKPVYHFALTWPEADSPSPDLQRRAVRESLQALGMQEHQALAVQHVDGKPHVHVVVNLIHPENGTSPKLSYTQKKLRSWANKFEQTHGLQITEGSRINEQKRQQGEQVDAHRKPRNVWEREQREGQDRRTAWLREQENDLARTLQRENEAMRQRHKAEWTAAKESYHDRKGGLLAERDREIKAAIEDTKQRYKAQWAQEFRQGRERLAAFEKSEKSALSRIANAAGTFWRARNEGKDMVGSVFAAASQAERRATIEAANAKRKNALSAQQRQDTAEAIAQIKRSYGVELDACRVDFLKECDALKISQNTQQDEQRQKWKDYNARRTANHFRMSAGQAAAQAQGRGHGLAQGFNRDNE